MPYTLYPLPYTLPHTTNFPGPIIAFVQVQLDKILQLNDGIY